MPKVSFRMASASHTEGRLTNWQRGRRGTKPALATSNSQMVSAAPLQPDAGLIGQAVSGDEAAFDALVGPVLEPAFKLANVMLRDREEARDAVQEACFMAWKNLPRLRGEDRFSQWFLAIVANRCRSVIRTRW